MVDAHNVVSRENTISMERFGTDAATENSTLRAVRQLGGWEAVVFCLIMATLMPLVMGYTFGNDDQLEQLPLLFRVLDPSYCSNDFFLNASGEFNPRIYYSWFLGALARYLPVPWLFLGLTWLTNVGLALITYGAARNVLQTGPLGGMMAVALEMATQGFTLGRPNFAPGGGSYYMLVPAGISSTIALASLWAGLRGRPIVCGALAAVACIVHPLIGAEVGAIGLATAFIVRWVRARNGKAAFNRQSGLELAIGGAILGATFLAFWHYRTASSLNAKEFIDMVGRFRGPHQYIPSLFRKMGYVSAAALLASFSISWRWWRQESRSVEGPVAYLVPVVIILLLWVGGYVFVEWIPSRLWLTAQTFRLGGVLTWMCFLLFARSIARLVSEGGLASAHGTVMLAGTGDAQALVLLLGHVFGLLGRVVRGIPEVIGSPLGLAFYVLVTGYLLNVSEEQHQSLGMLTAGALALWYLATKPSWWRNAVPLVLVFGLSAICLAKGRATRLLAQQVYELKPLGTPADDIAVQARRLTPPGAVFLTPSDWARFRLLAERAIVVDFKCVPFGDRGLLEWKHRIDDCYGPVGACGVEAVETMNLNYRQISQPKLLELAQRYGASHAVLYADTPCDLPSAYQNALYKIVRLPTQGSVQVEKPAQSSS